MVATEIVLGLAAIAVAITIVGIAYIEYLKGKDKKERKPDPIWRAFFLTFGVVLMSLIGETLGAFEQGFTKRFWWVFLVIFICVLAAYLWIARRKDPLPPDKLYNLACKWVDYFFQGKEYVGDAYLDPLDVLKVDEDPRFGMKEALRSGVFSALVSRLTLSGVVVKFFVQLNVYTGYLLHLQGKPPYVLEKRLVERFATMPKTGFVEEFGLEEEGKVEEPTEQRT